ncbi:MAG: hypothetical protein QOJ91_2286 [Sphingomonadales bacterium]|jgi:hypothetical protein|nr:hypothetical protein [Sphingomonadales bacterium]
MLKLNLLAAVAATLLVGGTAVAKDKAEHAPKEKKICTTDRMSTSRIPKKICRTQAELDRKNNQEDLDDAAGKLRGIGN